MTGFGRASFEVDGLHFDVEVRSVNHRYLNTRVRLPRLIRSFQADVRSRIQSRLDPGKTDLPVKSPVWAAPHPPPLVAPDSPHYPLLQLHCPAREIPLWPALLPVRH